MWVALIEPHLDVDEDLAWLDLVDGRHVVDRHQVLLEPLAPPVVSVVVSDPFGVLELEPSPHDVVRRAVCVRHGDLGRLCFVPRVVDRAQEGRAHHKPREDGDDRRRPHHDLSEDVPPAGVDHTSNQEAGTCDRDWPQPRCSSGVCPQEPVLQSQLLEE